MEDSKLLRHRAALAVQETFSKGLVCRKQQCIVGGRVSKLCRLFFAYLGSVALPVMVNEASDLALVSFGCAPPSVSVYLPGRIDRLP